MIKNGPTHRVHVECVDIRRPVHCSHREFQDPPWPSFLGLLHNQEQAAEMTVDGLSQTKHNGGRQRRERTDDAVVAVADRIVMEENRTVAPPTTPEPQGWPSVDRGIDVRWRGF